MTKVLIIGLDGATWDLIKPWADSELPTFKRLMENGVWAVLESTIPPWTFPAWESMCTGKNVGKLPLCTFMVKDGYHFEPYISKSAPPRRFFDVLVENGHEIILANLPNIHSAYQTSGIVVAGWFCTNEKELTYPSNLLFELDELLKEKYTIDIFRVKQAERFWIPKRNTRKRLKQIEALLNMHTSTFRYLLGQKPWDFAFVVLVTPDRIQHQCWDKEILLEHYRELDRKLGELLQVVDDDAIVFLVSDHGFGPVEFTFNINEWFIREGYLRLRPESERKEGYLRLRHEKRRKGLLLHLVDFLRKTKLFPLAAALVYRLPLSSMILRALLRELVSNRFEALEVDWENTKAFCGGVFGDIYLNLAGREPSGAVKFEEYGRIGDEIIDKLKNLKHPASDSKLSVKVFKKEDIYENSNIDDNKPDLVVLVTGDGIQSISTRAGSGQIFTESRGGEHRLNGCFLAHGPSIRKGLGLNNVKMYDIAPTILHMFDLPIPKDMDGRVLREIFEEGSEWAARETTYQEAKAGDEKERIKARIRGLQASDKT